MTQTRAWLVVLVATSTMTVSYVDRQALAVLAPTITHDLELSETAYGWVGSAFSVAYLVGAPLAGLLVDRIGARRALPAAVLVWSAVAGAHALVVGFASLVALRIALGTAEAPSFPSAAQTVARVLPPEQREAGFGVLFTGSSIGAAIAAALLPWLEARYGWRAALLVSAAVGLSWLPVWWAATAHPAVRAALTAPRPDDGGGLGPLWAIARHPAVVRAVLAVLASAPINGFGLVWGAKVLVARHALVQADVGRYLWLPPLLFDAGAVGFGVLAALRTRRTGSDAPHRALFAVAGLLLACIGTLGVFGAPSETTWVIGVALAGGGAVYTLCTADMLGRVPPSQIAAAGSITAAAQSIALIIAFPVVGRVLDATHGDYLRVGIGLAAWSVPGVVLWLLWDPRRSAALRAPPGR